MSRFINRFYFLFILGSCLFLEVPLLSQRPTISFEHYTNEEGLSAPVTKIIQDPYGFMWLGTTDGLNRFDGRNFIVYRNIAGDTTSLTNNIINALCTDQAGHVWVATNGGVCYYDFEDDGFHPIYFPDSLEKIDRHRVHAVCADQSGNIWFATRSHLHQWNSGKVVTSLQIPGADQFQITYLNADAKGQVWIGMNDGLSRYTPSTNNFIHLTITSPFTIEKGYTATVHPILPFQHDTMIIGSWYGGVQKVYPHGNELKSIVYTDPHESDARKHIIRGICPGQNGTYWVGTYGNGLSVFDSHSSTFVAHYHHDPADAKSLSNDYINDVYVDQTGILWLGTDAGLDKYDPFTQQFLSVSIPTFSGEFSVYRVPSSITEDPADPNQLIISISGAGIYQYNISTGDFILHRQDKKDPASLPDNSVYHVFLDRQGRHWIGTRSGISLANNEFSKFTRPSFAPLGDIQGIHKMLQDRDGNFWMASFSGGIYYYDESRQEITHYYHDESTPNGLPDNRVFCILLDHQGFLWVGTQNQGLCRFDPGTKTFTHFLHDKKNPNTIPDNGIYDLQEDEDHMLWIATENGLAKMNTKDFSITQYSTLDGLCNNDIFSITPDRKGFYWLATNNGMSRMDPKRMTFKNYYINDGLPSNRLTGSVFINSQNILFIGTSGKITYCKPNMLQINRHVPPVVITNFKIFDAREPIMRQGADLEPIRLSYHQNMITFDFAALNFTNSNLNQYAYRLEGFDDQWINCGDKQTATFTNLDGGTYTFHVKAANNDGVWNEEGAKVTIVVKPPFWETWWFYLLCFLAISGILYGAYQFRIKQLLRLQQIRLRISRDLHDDIGSTLSSINMISSMAQERSPADRRVPELFHTISNASHQAMELMNDIVWSINPKNDRMEMILIRMRQYASEILEAAKINFTLEMDDSCQQVILPIEKRKDFYLIFKEAINNMAKYSEANHASIELKYAHRNLILDISDDGKGFDADQIYTGNGLKNMKTRAQQLMGNLLIDTRPGNGTHIELTIPVTP